MSGREVIDMFEELGLPQLPLEIKDEHMADAFKILMDGVYDRMDAAPSNPIPSKSVQLSMRDICPRQACSRCSRQFLSPSQIAQLGDDLQCLDRNAYEERISHLSKEVLSSFAFIRAVGPKAVLGQISLLRQEFCKLLDKVFPHMMRLESLVALEQIAAPLKHARHYPEHGLKFFGWEREYFNSDNPCKDFFTGIFRERAQLHPAFYLTADNANLEAGWSLLAFKLLSAECFVDFSTAAISYCRVVDIVPGGLHKDSVYSATRAALLLDSQSIMYKGICQLTSWILAPEIPPQRSITWSDDDFHSRTVTLVLTMLLDDAVIPRLDDLIGVNKNTLSAYRTHTRDNVESILQFNDWLGKTDCPQPGALLRAFFRHTLLRLRHVALLQLLRQDFADLRTMARDFLQGRASKSKVLTAWESAEDSLSIFYRLLCKDALKLSPYFNHYEDIMYSHFNDWLSIRNCEDRHVSFSPGMAAGSAMLRLLCRGLTMPQKVSVVCSLLSTDTDECFHDELRLELRGCFRLSTLAYSALQTFNPCTDPPVRSQSAMRKLHGCFDLELNIGAASVLAKLLPAMKEVEAGKWAKMLWQKAPETVEYSWARHDMEVKWRQYFRQILSMPDRQDELRLSSTEMLNGESSSGDLAFELNPRADLGQVVEPFTAPDRGMRPGGHGCKSGSTLSGLWASDETLRDFGVSEGIKYGTPEKIRPSQFGEELPSGKTAKRRKALQTDHQSGPVIPAIRADIDTDSPQKLGFRDPVLYNIWCQIFPIDGCNVRQRIKWDELRRVMGAEPLYFEEVRNTGVEFRWRREARDGYPVFELGFHQPHGLNSWIEKNLLKHIRKKVHRFTGWDAETFVLIDAE